MSCLTPKGRAVERVIGCWKEQHPDPGLIVWSSDPDDGDGVIVELLKGDLHAEWFIIGQDFAPDETLRPAVERDLIDWLDQKCRDATVQTITSRST